MRKGNIFPVRGKAGFVTGDILIGVLIVGVWVSADFWLLGAPERDKRDAARVVVQAIANANAKRRSEERQAVTGLIGAAAPGRDLPGSGYDFFGADDARAPCIIARASRRVSGEGAAHWPYSSWGVCADRFGRVQDYWGSCSLSCEEKNLVPPTIPAQAVQTSVSSPAAPDEPVEPTSSPPRERRSVHQRESASAATGSGSGSRLGKTGPKPAVKERSSHFLQPMAPMVPVLPDMPTESPPAASSKGCSSAGCGAGECCESVSDRCVSCPGGSCCDQNAGCGGTCEKDDDCPQGCACSIPDGRSWGSCRVNANLEH